METSLEREDAENAIARIRAASVEINALAKIFRDKLDHPDSAQMILACGRAMANLHDELLKPIFSIYPDLAAESRRRGLAAFE